MNDSTDGWAWAPSGPLWRKSSHSAGGECFTVAEVGDDIAVRNSNHPEAGTLLFGRRGLASWIAGVKEGEFDDLTA